MCSRPPASSSRSIRPSQYNDLDGDGVIGAAPTHRWWHPHARLSSATIRRLSGPDTNYLRYTGDDHVRARRHRSGQPSSGNDILIAGIGDDTLFGDGGNDQLEGGFGNDIINAGDGDDIITDMRRRR